MKRTHVFMVMVMVMAALMPVTASAVSYPVQVYPQEIRHDQYEKGETLYLFHSGTEEIRRSVHPNDILTVYRISRDCSANPVGQVRVVALVGATHLKAEVVSGEIRPDDIVRKGEVSFLVISAGTCGD